MDLHEPLITRDTEPEPGPGPSRNAHAPGTADVEQGLRQAALGSSQRLNGGLAAASDAAAHGDAPSRRRFLVSGLSQPPAWQVGCIVRP
jgi:hypothetical protein